MQEKPSVPDAESLCQKAQSLAQMGQLDQALRTARLALEKDASSFQAHFLLGVLYGRKGMTREAMQELCAAVRLDPHHARAHYNLGVLLQQQGRLHEALWATETASRLSGSDEKVESALKQLRTRLRDEGAYRMDAIPPIAGSVPLWWRAARMVYLVMLTLMIIGFYVLALSLMAAFFAGGILAAVLIITNVRPIYTIQVALSVGAGLVLVGWLLLRNLFVMAREPEPYGIQKARGDLPRLWRVIHEVANRVGTSVVDAVFLTPYVNASVTEYGGRFGLPIGTTRVLTLGVGLVEQMTLTELKAVLAHELAHFSHQDPALARYVHHVTGRLFQMLGNVRFETEWWWANPAYWILYAYLWIYCLAVTAFERQREYWADRLAATAYGGNVYQSVLEKLSEAAAFEALIAEWAWHAAEDGKYVSNIYTAVRQIRSGFSTADLKRLRFNLLRHEQHSLFSTHPATRERIARAKDINPDTTDDSVPALVIFENPIGVEEEMSGFLAQEVHRAHALWSEARGEDENVYVLSS